MIQDDNPFPVQHGPATTDVSEHVDPAIPPVVASPADEHEGFVFSRSPDLSHQTEPVSPARPEPQPSESSGVGLVTQALTPCSGITLTRWPLDGTNGQSWLIQNYTDRNAAAGSTRDYTGQTGALARTYDAHTGADIGVPSFREMDNETALVRAAASGTVVRIVQNLFDRETTFPANCTRQPNFIEVDHGNGYHGFYLHIKKNSARVLVGNTVTAGTVLAVVGSAGCSSHPHLHFELQCGGTVLEPFSPNLWSSAPVYRPTSNVLDTMVRAGGAPTAAQVQDPGPDATVVQPNSLLGLGVMLGAVQGDVLHMRIKRPNGTQFTSLDWTVTGSARYGMVPAAFQFRLGSDAGSWSVEAQVNSGRTVTKRFLIGQVTVRNVAEASFQSTFDGLLAQGYRLSWIDAYTVSGNVFFNGIFVADGVGFYARSGLTATQLQTEFNNIQSGFRPSVLESYARGSEVRYAVIFVQQSGTAWQAYAARTATEHQNLFNQFVASGHRLVNVSSATVNGTTTYTALYDKANVGAWEARGDMDINAFQTFFNAQLNLGREHAYMNADVIGGVPRFSAIFDSRSVGSFQTRIALTPATFDSTSVTQETGGLLTRLVVGYDQGGTVNLGGIWRQQP